MYRDLGREGGREGGRSGPVVRKMGRRAERREGGRAGGRVSLDFLLLAMFVCEDGRDLLLSLSLSSAEPLHALSQGRHLLREGRRE